MINNILSKDVTTHTNPHFMKTREGYENAKRKGDLNSAKEVVDDCVKENRIKEICNKYHNAIVVPVQSINTKNMLPIALALKFQQYGLKVDLDIKQKSSVSHTGNSGINRYVNVPEYTGNVISNAEYIIVDDVVTAGSSLMSLKNFIEENGGKVVAISTLTYGRMGSTQIQPNDDLISQLQNKFGEELNSLLQKYGLPNIEKLSYNTLLYLRKYGSLQSLEKQLQNFKNGIDKMKN